MKRDLINNFSVKPQGILDSIKYHVATHVVYTPIYSKNLLFNNEVMHGEWSFVGGAGMVGYTSGDTAPMYGGGLIGRFFKSNIVSYKFDARIYAQTAQNKSSDLLLMLNIGMSFEIGGRTQRGRTL
ncbi:MAG: hypothetical protein IPK04_17720 [Bdellovibrionales bacterium]|nr:hypothetical protein [Bdellovibrionales bacterium]